MTRWLIATVCVVLLPAVIALAADVPPIFDTRPYAEAKKAAERAKKWFIVKATADWCPPCKQMDKTTWRDEKIEEWMKDNGIVVAVDVDKEKKLAEELEIEAMPTMIAFKDGKEFDRVVGYRSPSNFLVWLEGIAKGEKSIEVVKKRAARGAGDGGVQARLQDAQALARSRNEADRDKATEEFAWLWDHMLAEEPAMVGVRSSFMAGYMGELARKHGPAKKKFTELRDRAAEDLKKEKVDPDGVSDWIVLNQVIGDDEATLAWLDKAKKEARWKPVLARLGFRIERLLLAHDRWEDLGNLYGDPIRHLEQAHEIMSMTPPIGRLPEGLDEKTRKMVEEMPARQFRETAGQLYAGLLAAKRDKDAAKVADRARELDAKPGMVEALIRTAMKAKQARPHHVEWARAAAKSDQGLEDLAGEVEEAMKEAGEK